MAKHEEHKGKMPKGKPMTHGTMSTAEHLGDGVKKAMHPTGKKGKK